MDVRIGDHYLLGQFQNQHPQQLNEYVRAGWRIRDGLPTASPIDDFLDMHSHDELMQAMGKAAIVKAIIMAERGSDLYFSALTRVIRVTNWSWRSWRAHGS